MPDSSTSQFLFLIAFFLLWFITVRFVLPRLGVPT